MITLTVNGKTQTVEAAPDTPLLWVLRDHLSLTGSKYACGIGKCGACAVHLNGDVAMSCQVSVGKSAGAEITTIEGLGANGLHPIQKAFIEENTTQCGCCIPGQIMALAAMLDSNPEPTDNEIDLALKDNLCRCGAYTRIRKAVHTAARSMA